jgi:CBS domain containing-hemolysin-like protein
LEEGLFVFSARHEIDYLNEVYDLKLPESESYETLGGFIISHLEYIPAKGESLRFLDLEITILKVSSSRIDTVEIKLLNKDE